VALNPRGVVSQTARAINAGGAAATSQMFPRVMRHAVANETATAVRQPISKGLDRDSSLVPSRES
jgi:hypothetical protein